MPACAIHILEKPKKLLIGITGDTHNNLKNNNKLICNIFNKIKPSFVLHTGDITLPKSSCSFSELKMLSLEFLVIVTNRIRKEKLHRIEKI